MSNNNLRSDMWGSCIWGIDDNGKLYIGEGVATSIADGSSPWDKFRDEIKEVETFGEITVEKGASLCGLFKNCRKLEKANLKDMNTAGASSMESMFEGCESLKEAELGSFDTSDVLNMGRMFAGCKKLSNLDLSSFDTRRAENMKGMFDGCNILHNLAMGNQFSVTGNGETSCGNLSIRDNGKYRLGKVIVPVSISIVYNENYGRPGRVEQRAINGMAYTVDNMMFDDPSEGHVFTGWNTSADGMGTSYEPGDVIGSIDRDLELYAIWGSLPKIGHVQNLTEIEYGQRIDFELPEIISENDSTVKGHLEISADGEEGTWEPISRNAILPVACNGYLLRLCASNKVGSSYSNSVRIRIRKAGIDLSKVRWAESEDMTYDGQPKKVWLEGLPAGVTATYNGNEAAEAGEYVASVELACDTENFSLPAGIRDYEWSIKKAQYDMSKVRWEYEDAFTYDGSYKEIVLAGLPEGVKAEYEGNKAVNAGKMTATATLAYDTLNHEKPSEIVPCIWEIKKKAIETGTLEWTSCSDFVYDGNVKKVAIKNLPADAEVEYRGEEETLAGQYLASANVYGNYYLTSPAEYGWEIGKADYDLSEVKWNYTGPVTFDREIHDVGLVNLPAGINATYHGHIAGKAGDYNASASFTVDDSHNYNTPDDMSLLWTIRKAVVDMSGVKWNYSEPFVFDGSNKRVELTGLPKDVYAIYEDNCAANAGVYTAHAVMKYDDANYIVEQPADCQWQIQKTEIDISSMYWDYAGSLTYTGEACGVALANIPEGLNVEYSDNSKINAGKYVARAKLKPVDSRNYEEPEINGCTWSIEKKKLEKGDIRWSEYEGFVYDGTEKSVAIVSDIDEKIRVEYTANKQVNAGDYTAVAKFFPVDTENYEAPEEASYKWHIDKGDFDMKEVVWDYSSAFTYDGAGKTVKLINLPEGVVAHYTDAVKKDAGTYTAVADFEVMNSGNYNDVGSMSLNWEIRKAEYNMKDVKWQDTRAFEYSGDNKSVELIGLPAGVEPVYTNNTAADASEYIASVDFRYDENNYEKPSFDSCRWKIVKSDFNPGNARWDYEEAFVYDRTEKKVRVIDVPDGAYVEYSNECAVDAGTYVASAELIAEDTNNCNNVRLQPLTWKIARAEYDMSAVRWDYDREYTYDGSEKKVVLKGLPEGVFPVYHNNSATEAGEYEASVTFDIADKNNYNVPEFPSCRWKINKADYDMTGTQWNYSGEYVYNGRMQEVVLTGLPAGVRAIYDGNCATNAGAYKAKAELIPYDEANYNAPAPLALSWEIVKADYDMAAVKWDHKAAKAYNGREQVVELENLPGGVQVSYSGNSAKEVGKYSAKALLNVSDPANYNVPSIGDCAWEISKAEVDMSKAEWNYTPGSLVYDGAEKKVELTGLPEGVSAAYKNNTGIKAGSYLATAEFDVEDENYSIPQPISFEWAIDKADCDLSQMKWDYSGELTYTGKIQGIELENVPEVLKVACTGNQATDVGEYQAVASFTAINENYKCPEDAYFRWSIKKANPDIAGIRWDYDKKFIYDGGDKVVELAGVPDSLVVTYSGNRANVVGNFTAHAELYPVDDKNFNIPSIRDCSWQITKAKYDMSNAAWIDEGPFTYDGTAKSVHIEGLPAGVKASYTDNTAVDTGKYTAKAVFDYDYANYIEPTIRDHKWSINKSTYDMSGVSWDYAEPFVYDGEIKEVQLTGLPEGLSPIYSGNTAEDSGDYTASVSFEYDDRNYKKPEFGKCKWTIEKAEIAIDPDDFAWNYSEAFVYDGEPKSVSLATHTEAQSFLDKLLRKAPVVKLAGVPEGIEAFYEDNECTNVGTYFAKAVLKHTTNNNIREYTVPECKWEIKKAKLDMSEVRWDYSEAFTFDGEEKSVRLVGVPEQLIVHYSGNAATDAGAYEAQAEFELKDPDNYVLPSPVKACWWVINKASYDMSNATWAYDDNIVYNGKEKSVKVTGLPEGVRVEAYSGNKAIEAGYYTAEAIFKYKDRDNYETPELPALRWRIRKKKIDTSKAAWSYSKSAGFVFDGTAKEVKLTGLPKDIETVYVDNSKINAGSYVARAKLVYDTKNFEADPIPDCSWTIDKAEIETAGVHWNYEKPFVYDGTEKSISLRNVPEQIDVRYRDNKASTIGTYTAKAYLSYDRDNYNSPDIESTIDWEIIKKQED
ncbi:MAG: BspA family leucine-rich repeat surface protein [Clostridiales bacterium]|nr:BspA family leucine-rich repeat surface protein [Candidatus Crickella caballi]